MAKNFKKNFYKCNLLNFKKTKKIINQINPNTIIHLAALSTVNEKFSTKDYLLNNLQVTKNILDIMIESKIDNIIFSSTAAVYKNKDKKIDENSELKPINKYGKSKLQAEKIIKEKN